MKLIGMIITGATLALLSLLPASVSGQEAMPVGVGLDHRAAGLRLSDIRSRDMFIQAMWEAKLPGGMVVSWSCGDYPTHDFPLLRPSVREVLDSIVSVEPEYSWEINDGIVNLVARGKEPLLFQTKIAKFEVTDATSLNLVMQELVAVPSIGEQVRRELGRQLLQFSGPYPYPMPERRKFSVSLTNVTVREALNAIARAGSGIWIFQRNNCPNVSRQGFTLDFVDLQTDVR